MTDNPDDIVFPEPDPIALFPVRLETRFFPGTSQPWELRIRVYPDTITANTHDPQISDVELLAGKQFVEDTWRAGPDVARQQDAYGRLCDRVGEPRAAYLANTITPQNPNDRPTSSVDHGEPLAKTPQFGSLPSRGPNKLVGASAILLPDRWLATAYTYHQQTDGTRQLVAVGQMFGRPIHPDASPLRIGVSSDDSPAGDGASALRLDPSLAWLVDFDAAEQAGMALRLSVPTDQLARVVVVGLRESSSAGDGAAAIEMWLTNQRYSHGIACVPPGTPTRNTGDALSGYTPAPTAHGSAFAAERGAPLYAAATACAGSKLARALGISDDAFAHVEGADATTDVAASAMVTALWPVTWGYYLGQMMRPLDATAAPIVSADAIAWARQHAIDYLRPGGALSCLRVGDLVYGVLPTTSWTRYVGSDQNLNALNDVLTGTRPIWNRAAQRVPKLSAIPSEAELLQILRQASASLAFACAPVRGPAFFTLLESLLKPFLFANWQELRGLLSDAVLSTIGIHARPKLAATTSEAGTHGFVVVDAPLVAAQLSETEALAGTANYFAWILQAGYLALRDEKFTDAVTYTGNPNILLYKLLRHAVLLTYLSEAQTLVPGILLFAESEFMLSSTGQPTVDALVEPFAQLLQAAMAAPLGDTTKQATPVFRALRDSLLHLSVRPTAEINRLAAETLDAASHRIDAWVGSLANARLAEVRARVPTGVRIGAYGWIDGVDRTAEVSAPPIPGDTGAPPVVDSANQGYLLAPSLAHATTAAVLRSGQLAHDPALAAMHFDLSPSRVRSARRLIAGVQTGQPLAALLGYELERALHAASLDRYIAPLRSACPLVAGKGAGGSGPVTQLAAANVVDGVMLHQRLQKGDLPFGITLPASGTADHDALMAQLAVLEESYAAVADVLTAESVHHLVRGDATRSVAALDPIAAGEALPTRLDLATTPRTGTTVSHRVIVDFSGEAPAAWVPATDDVRALQVRAAVDPQLDAWVARWLGDPRNVRCTVMPADGIGGGEITLDQLGLSALDVLALAESIDASDFSRFAIARAAERKIIANTGGATINFSRQETWPARVVDVPTLLAIARRVSALLAGARPVDARDFAPTGTTAVASGVDAVDLAKRANLAFDELSSLVTDGAAVAATGATAGVQAKWLWRAAYLGVPGAVPYVDDPNLAACVARVRDSVAARASALAKIPPAAGSDPPDTAVATTLTRLAAALGRGPAAVPRFTTTNAADVQAAFGIAAGTSLDAITWLQRAARVQPGCARLLRAALACESMNDASLLTARVAQLPFAAGAQWAGNARSAVNGALSLVIVGGSASNPTAIPASGLMLDHWNEVVPQPRETAAIAFHYDNPPGRAPHAILLAVPSTPIKPWTYTDVRLVVNDTLDLAMCRAVDQTTLFTPRTDVPALNLSQYLPAIYLANNANKDTVSTSFGPKPNGA